MEKVNNNSFEFDLSGYTEPTEEEIREMELRKLKLLLEKENNYIELDEYEKEEIKRLLEKYREEE